MIINENLLLAYGAEYVDYEIKQTIFDEGNTLKFHYQIVEGIVELTNFNDEGKEFTQNILSRNSLLRHHSYRASKCTFLYLL